MSEEINKDVLFDEEFIQFFREKIKGCNIKQLDETTFILFNHGQFYSIHDENAEYVCRNFLNSIENLKTIHQSAKSSSFGDENDDPMIGDLSSSAIIYTWISLQRFPSLIRFLLLDNNFSVKVYSKTNPKSIGNKQWRLELEASPGYLGPFEQLLLMNDDQTNDVQYQQQQNFQLSSVYVEENHCVHISSIDPVSCTIYLGSFQDNDCLRQLETILVRTNPKECLVDEMKVMKKLTQMLKQNDILMHKYPSMTFHQDDYEEIYQVLNNLLLPQSQKFLEDFLKQHYQSEQENNLRLLIPLKPLLERMKLFVMKKKSTAFNTNNEYPFESFFLQPLEPEKFVRLDLSSLQHLHIFPTRKQNSLFTKQQLKQSLYQILNHCQTNCGQKLLEQFIRQPCLDRETIQNRLDIVEFFINNPDLLTMIREKIFGKIPDISKLYRRLSSQQQRISSCNSSGSTNVDNFVKDFFILYFLLEQLRQLYSMFTKTEESYPLAVKQEIIDRLAKCITESNVLYMKLTRCLDLETFTNKEEYRLNAKTFPVLEGVITLMNKSAKRINKDYEDLRKQFPDAGIMLEDNHSSESAQGIWYYRVTNTHKGRLTMQKDWQIISRDSKDLKFVTRFVTEINREYDELRRHLNKLQQQCLKLMHEDCREHLHRISKLEYTVALLDVLMSYSKMITESSYKYSKPKILDQGSQFIELKQFRHPILEAIINVGEFVPNDLCFNQNCKYFIVNGPNMGGKSTFLRSIGLAVLMTQIGCYVPCQEATISLVDAIYTRINSSDNQNMGISTFMAEMHEMAGILKSSTENSLVLIDELGRSTSTNDGFSLAQAITEYLVNHIRSYTLFATHFYNLGYGLQNVCKLLMKSSFNQQGKLILHYRADPIENEDGNPTKNISQSFGIEVMKHIQMPKELIKQAEVRLTELVGVFNTDSGNGVELMSLEQLVKDIDQENNSENFKVDRFLHKLEKLI